MGNRRFAREMALRILFESDFTGGDVLDIMTRLVREEPSDPETQDFLAALVRACAAGLRAIDVLIEERSDNWKLGRMASVDRNLLRLGATEILYLPDVPKSVSINEYLEIAKKFGTEDSSSFINGILDKIVKPDPLKG